MHQKKWTRVRMYPHVEEYESRDISQKEYCEEKGIKLATFVYWLGKYRKERKPMASTPEAGFMKLNINGLPNNHLIEVHFPGGVKVQIHHAVPASYLSELISHQ